MNATLDFENDHIRRFEKSAGIEDENVYAALVRCNREVELITEAIEEIVCGTVAGLHVELITALELRLVDDRAV
jgi:hypothetical protein